MVVGCPHNSFRFNIYVLVPGKPWALLGSACLAPPKSSRPVNFAAAARHYFDQMPLPPPRPSFEPPRGAIVNLPTVFAAGGPRELTRTFDIGGIPVTVVARASSWVWTFDQGVVESFDQPGGRYPDQAVTYTYDTAGTRLVRVVVYWTAKYRVGRYNEWWPVTGAPVPRAGTVRVPVHPAQSVLVSQ
jgi:hypothetical protein